MVGNPQKPAVEVEWPGPNGERGADRWQPPQRQSWGSRGWSLGRWSAEWGAVAGHTGAPCPRPASGPSGEIKEIEPRDD